MFDKIALLLKITQNNLQQLQQNLLLLLQNINQKTETLQQLKRSYTTEQQLAEDLRIWEAWEHYKQHNLEQQQQLEQKIAKLNQQRQALQERIMLLASNVRRYEIYIEQQEAKQQEIAEDQAQAEQDELSMLRFNDNNK